MPSIVMGFTMRYVTICAIFISIYILNMIPGRAYSGQYAQYVYVEGIGQSMQ
jgi:hypothetical protein